MKTYYAVVQNRQGRNTATTTMPDFQQVESCHRSAVASDNGIARARRKHPGVPFEIVETSAMLRYGAKI